LGCNRFQFVCAALKGCGKHEIWRRFAKSGGHFAETLAILREKAHLTFAKTLLVDPAVPSAAQFSI
jgi:hypothetical protein